MICYFALAQEELARFDAFRVMESQVRTEISVEIIDRIKAEAREAASLPILEVKDGVANIKIEGTLEQESTISSSLMGPTTSYKDIEEATQRADADPFVQKIAYHIDSPGGNWNGLDYAAEVIKTAEKPTEAIVYTGAHSGGYYLASQADKIYAATKGSSIGSIGIASEVYERSKEEEQKGIKRYVLTNTLSKDKRPDIKEEEGYAVYQERLDALYDIFENRVVDGRKQSVKDFTADTVRGLKGRSVTAEKALELGFIDGILSEMSGKKKQQATGGRKMSMTLQEFITANPTTAKDEIKSYAAETLGMAVAADTEAKIKAGIAEGLQGGIAAERKRTLEVLALSGVQVSDLTKTAIESGKDTGEFAKEELANFRKAQSGGNNLTPPKVEQSLANQTTANETVAKDAVTDEDEIRRMAKGGR